MRIFGSVKPQSESNFPFLYIKDFKHTDLWRPLAPLLGEIDLCTKNMYAADSTWQHAVNTSAARRFGKPAATADFVSAHTSTEKLTFFDNYPSAYVRDRQVCFILHVSARISRNMQHLYRSISSLPAWEVFVK